MAVLKAVQKGTATIAAGASSGTATITAITTANSFLRFTYRCATDTTNPVGFGMVGGVVTNTTTLTFTRGTATSSPILYIEWSVVEFTSGVTVQRGSTNTTGTTTNVTITSVTTTKAWPIASSRKSVTSTITGQDIASVAITSATNLAIVNTGWEEALTMAWQVIEYDNCTVALYTHNKTGAGTSNQTVTAVTTAKTLIFATYSWDEDPAGANDLCRMYLSSTTNVAFTSVGWQAGTYVIKLYTVNISDAVVVQRGDTSVASGNTVETPAISEVTTANSIVHVTSTFENTAGTTANTGAGLNTVLYTASISSTTAVTLTRTTSGNAGTCAWEVADFTGLLVVSVRRVFLFY